MSDRPVRVRIAPSPTGDPHVGTCYVGLINEVFARQRGGKFVLRIEDTDQTRSAPVYEQAIFDALRWFGLTWDEGPDVGGPHGPYRQSERAAIYQTHVQQLIDSGHAYRCFCTAEELAEMRATQKASGASHIGYDRRWRDRDPADVEAALAEGRSFVVRLKMPREGETEVPDRLRGGVSFRNELIDDQVLMKSDGLPTYHLANVVDDHLMGITHVIRAEEWLASTPKHIVLYQAFGWEAPEFIHLPLLRNADKSKISKRKNPVSVNYYRKAGFMPAAMRNYLALMGWAHPDEQEFFDLAEYTRVFDVDRISLGGPVFDLAKLKAINARYIRETDSAALLADFKERYLSDGYLADVLGECQPRIQTLEELFTVGACFFGGSVEPEPAKLVFKGHSPSQSRKLLLELSKRLDVLGKTGYTDEAIEQVLRGFAADKELKARVFFSVIRFAITGAKVSPPLFSTMRILGRELVRRRLKEAQDLLRTVKV